MKTSEIMDYLEENGLSEIEEVKTTDDFLVIKFFYDFDKEEIEAAESYAKEESDFEAESEEWYSEFYIPYLKDIAIDNVEGIMEDLMEDLELEGKFKHMEIEASNCGYLKFVSAFSSDDNEIDLEEVLNDYVQ
ncbi:hypothetical protein [Clostridium uliginosum]|uniref:Uncharacterized protein n=1 Tax=Clostridium uliginosum TaxID=119641 RepID=A0A1I1RU22_9CLOT|nr:hypothetical protein [Clostridium uliginosum]SFD37562.1 hypothetical protein SAMN05421842_13820 [Clostridium uliginosum]